MKFKLAFDVPESKKVRVIVHTDCANEADDQFALAHHLMTPKFIVRGIIAGHFELSPRYGKGQTVQASYDEIIKVMDLMGIKGEVPVYKGVSSPLPDEKTPLMSEGAQFIIDEAMRDDDPRPLYVVFQGAITDLAAAILTEPKICDRMTAVWIGGGEYPNGGFEFNLKQDINAGNVVMASTMPFWQVPINAYKSMSVTLAELQHRVKPYGKIGNYLFTQMVELNNKLANIPHWPHGESWGLGDQPTVTVLLVEQEKTDIFDLIPAPRIAPDMTYIHDTGYREIRVYNTIDSRMTLEDFYAKLAINFPDKDS